MALYYYNKYTSVPIYTCDKKETGSYTGTNSPIKDVYSSYTQDSDCRFRGVGTPQTISVDSSGNRIGPESGYRISNNGDELYHYWNTRVIDTDYGYDIRYSYRSYSRTSKLTGYSRGNLVTSNIIAEDGTYPTNGRHSDGYWYVRGSLVTPGTPTSITVPTEIKGGTTITISWGTSSNSDSFRLERQLNGGSWSQIYSGTARSYSDTIPKGTISVAYRVRGANGTAYSSYKTSPTITVKNFPEMWIRVNGALKTSDAGWVRVNGQLREIDTMWVRINGALKEVQ